MSDSYKFSDDPATNQWAFWAFLDARKRWEEQNAAPAPDPAPFPNPWEEQIRGIRAGLDEVEAGHGTLEKLNACRKLFTLLLEDRYQAFITAHPKFERAVIKKIAELRADVHGVLLTELFSLVEGKIKSRYRNSQKPKRPLTWWQEMVQQTGRLLTDNEVELHPGVKDDVRLLSVFCSFARKATLDAFGDRPISEDHTLALARSWHAAGGRAGLSDPEAAQRWFFNAMPPPPRS